MEGHAYDGIHELDNPLPRWWLGTFAITVVFGLFYWMALHSLPSGMSSFDAYAQAQETYDLEALGQAVDPAAVKALASDSAAVASGKATFGLRCASCHGPDGQGAVGPNLTDRAWIHGGDLRSIYVTVSGGYPKLGMPEWRAVLDDKQIAQVVAFLITIRDTNIPGKEAQGTDYVGDLIAPPQAAP